MDDMDNKEDLMSSMLPWQHCVQQLRYLKKSNAYIIASVRKYFKDLSPVDIEEFITDTPMPTAWVTSKGSTVTSEQLIQCIHTMMLQLNSLSESRGLLLGVYLKSISDAKQSKDKSISDIGKEHVELFKKLDL